MRFMMIRHRVPRIKDSLRFLKESGYVIDYCLDIGVHTGTPWLTQSFPKAHYVLIEPDTKHNTAIHNNYKNYSYELINIALGGKTEQSVYLNCIHDGKTFGITCDMVTLDSLQLSPPENSLCKIDVDGYELDILDGAYKTLPKFDLIIIESQLDKMSNIVYSIEDCGFKLWDIVNMDYELGNLHQVDLVFKKEDFTMKKVLGYPDYDFFRQGSEFNESN